MKRFLFTFTAFSFLCFKPAAQELPSLKWPVDTPVFLSMFAQPSQDYSVFNPGVIFSEDEFAKASQYGKKLITIEKKYGLKGFPSALGNAVIVAHEAGLQTVYGGLAPGEFAAGADIESGAIIGRAGKTASGKYGGIIFQVIDTKEKIFINPVKLLPYQNLNDKLPPSIKNTVLVNENGKTFNLDSVKHVKQGKYDLYSSIKDGIRDSGENFSPLEISVFVNGMSSGRIPFYELEAVKNEIYLKNTKLSAEKLYGRKNSIYLGRISLTRGNIELVLNVSDLAQNETKMVYNLKAE